MNIKTLFRTLLLFIVFACTVGTTQAYEGRYLAHEDIVLYGMGLKVEPARQVVPKNIATIVSAYLQVPTLPAGEISPLAPDALVKGTLRGPGLETPLELSAKANTPFNIPPLTVPGMYSLDDIRLESGGEILFRGTPESVSIEIIEKLLVSQITARPLTAQEIKDKGIVFDKSNFQAYNFTAAFAVGSGEPIKIDMPVLLPNLAGATDVNVSEAGLDSSLPEPQLKDVRTIIPDALKLAQTKIPNLSVKTFSLKALDYKGNSFDLPPIPGVIVIPGDIGFLNQYFSVMLMVGNVAPEYSNLVVKDITATILLPSGNDKVVGSGDDPLAMAMTAKGPSPSLQAVVQPGLDGKLGTADDIVSLAPGQSGNAEFLVEGRREGSHTIEMEITGTLEGLPIGPVTVRGRAMGTVLVRNPNFTLTFTHPDVVNAGEEYVLDVTVTNTSESPANFVSVNLHQQQISGADLVGEGSKEIESIPPGDSATVSFNLRSKVTGTIFAATLDSDEHVSGRFQLKTSVGELGIPLSPDSLVLPKEAGSLPKVLRDAAIGLLGKAYAVATAPAAALPKDIVRFGKKIVWDRGIEVAQAGFRYTLHEPLPDSAEQLLFDFMGSNYTRLAETNPLPADRSNAESDYSGFDDLRRRSIRGDVLAGAVANLLQPDLLAKGGSDFQRDLASKIAYRPGHISVLVDAGGGPLPVRLTLMDSQGRKLGGVGDKGKIVKEIPYGDYLTLKDQTTTSGQLALIAVPAAGSFRIRLERLPGADPAATFNLGIVAPDAAGTLQQRSFSAVTTGTLPAVDLPGSPYSFTVEVYADGLPLSGTPQPAAVSRPMPDIAPSIISVVQQPEADKVANDCGTWRFGRVVAVLFSEEVTPASVQDKLDRNSISNYTLDGNQVVGVALQPGRRIAFLALRDPVGPFVPRSITFNTIADRQGNQLASQSIPIEATIQDPAAVVSGKVLQPDGTPLSGAEVRLFTLIQAGPECSNSWYGVSTKSTGDDASFAWDFVLKQTDKIVAINPDDGEFRSLPFTVARNGQRLNVNVVFLGRGVLTGKVLGEDGMTPLKDAQIRVTSLTDNSQYAFTTDSTGKYTISKIPVGNLIIEAVHLGTNSKSTQSGYIGAAGTTVELNLVLLTEALRKITVQYGAVSGHVLHYDGMTVAAGLPVYGYYQDNSQDGVRCPVAGESRPSECAVATGTTSAAGAYSFPELPAGDYRIYTFDQAASQEGTARISVAANGTASANILLNGGFGTIKGIVKDADGTPVADAEVGGGLSLTRTDANGLFTLTDVPVGARTIVAVSLALLAQGQAVVDVSTQGAEYGATIVLQSQGGIYGTIHTADGALASGIKINLLQNDGLVAVATTNASGAYQFPNVPVSGSDYSVSAFLPDLSDGNIGSTAIRFQGQRVRLDLTFKGKGTVTGGLFDSNGTTPLVGKVSVSALRVVAAQSGQDLVGLRFEYTSHLKIVDTTFSSNRFNFDNVFVGPFVITAAGAFSPDPVTFAGEITSNGETQDLLIKLTATSVITGTVFGPDGVSVSKNALVTFKSDEFKTICAENSMGDTVCTAMPQGIQEETAVSDEFGKFTLPLVNAGKFTLSVVERDAAGNVLGHIGKLSGLVRAGQTADVALRLQARAPVRVTVYTHNSTTPVPNAWVTIEEASKIGDTSRKFKTDANGVVQFSGPDALNEGSFTVMAESNDGFVGRSSGRIVADGSEVAVNVYLFDHTVTVKGVVYRPDGITPVANAEVSISNAQGDLAFAVTNASGEYMQDYIPLGDFRVELFEAATGRRGFGSATAYLSTPIVTVNISELAIGQVQGTLYQGGALTPLSRWQVTLNQTFPSGRGLSLVATTGLDGRFVFPGVPVGEFRITAWTTGQNPVTAQGYLTREGEVIDIPLVANLVKPALGTINGWVYHPDGTPAADSAICLNPSDFGCSKQTTADRDGRFAFNDVPLGRFTVQAGSPVTRESGIGYGELPYAGATGYVKVVLAGLGTVSGMVLDNGVIFVGAKVVLEKSPDAGCGSFKCITYSNPTTGQFTFLNVPAGTFSVYAEDPTNAQKNGSAGGLLNPGGTVQVTIPFADTGSLVVKVLFASGSPAPGILAEIRRQDGFALYHKTDASGLVTFKGVPKGDYQLTLQDPAGLGLARKSLQILNDLDLSNAPLMLDGAPPAVKASSPLPGEIRVALATPIVITFSEPVQPGSIDAASVSLTSPTGPVDGFRVLSANDTVVTFTPLQPLKDESLYTIRVSGVRDRVDRPMLQDFVASFTTMDITPPHVVSLSPAQGSSGAPLESVIRVMFSEPVNPSAFTGQAITVTGPAGAIAGRVDMVFGNTGMVFTPTYPLATSTTYTVTLLPASDLVGNQQTAEPVYAFSSLDRTPPVISSLTAPATVIENAVATVTPVFSGGSDIAVVDWYLNGAPAGAVRFAQSASFNFSFQVIPTLGVPGGIPIRVSAIATDTSGNRALLGTETAIAVIADAPPTATITLPAGGISVRNSDRVVVRVEALDDMGVTRVAYQATGGQFPAADIVAVAPAATTAQHDFAFYVPVDAVPGSQIVINATVVDSKGQSGKAAPVTVTVSDATPPVVIFAGLSSGAVVRPGQKITAVVTASDLGGIRQVSFRANSGTPELRDITPAQNSVAATFSYTVPNTFTSHDTVRLEASATDVAGNSTDAAAVVLPVADTTPPLVTIRTAGSTDFMVPGQTVTIIVDAQDDASVTGISLNGSGAFTYSDTAVVTPAGTAQKSFTINIPANLTDGAVLALAATATDASGNVSLPAALNLTARILTSLQLPASQLLAAGDTVPLAITLDQPAPAAGLQVDLMPATAAIQLQPASLVFAAGETVKSFTLTGLSGASSSFGVALQGVNLGRVTVTVRGGVVSGTVVTSAQQPVVGAEVVVNGITATSGADGTFLLEGIAGPAVSIKAFDTVNKLQGAAGGTMNAANGFLRGLKVIVTEAGSVTGTVKQANQTPVGEGVQVDLMDPQNSSTALFTTFTAADGSYSFPQVPLGTYTVEARDTNANRGRSTAYLNVGGAEVVVPVAFLGKGTVNGTVRNASSNAVSDLTVTMQSSSIFGSLSRTTVTDSSGGFSFSEVSVGSFSLSTKDDASNMAASTTGTIAMHGQTVTANLNLAAWASLEGHVYRVAGSAPAAGVTVQASGHTTTTDSAGAYRFEVLPLGYYTLSAQDTTARTKGQASLSLQVDQENRVQDITLNGSGSMAVSVIDNSYNPVSGAKITLYDGFGYIAGSSDAIGTLVFEHVYPGNYEVKAVSGNLHGSITGSIAVGDTASIFVTIAADPSGTIAGTVFAPDGQTPAGGVSVTARLSGCVYYCSAYSMSTAGDGTYQFTTLPLQSYDLTVTGANGQSRAKASAIQLSSDGQAVTRDLTMVGLGTVNGRVLEPNSSTGSPNMPVTVRSLNPDFGRAYSVRTNAAGFYQVDQVPVGAIAVSAGEISQQKLGDASGTLPGDGATLTLDVALQSNAVTLPQSLNDGNAISYAIQGNGSLNDYGFGTTGAMVLELTPSGGNPVSFEAVSGGTQEQLGREIALRQADVAGLTVTRKVYVPQDGYFARYLEIIDNLTGIDKTVSVGVKSSFLSESYNYYHFLIDSTSSGDKLLQTGGQAPDYWAVFDNSYDYGTNNLLKPAMVWSGPGAATPISKSAATPLATNATTFNTAWDLTVPANGRAAIMHFVVRNLNVAGAKASAERLLQLPPEALAGLSQDELLAIRNFAVPVDGSSLLTAMPALTGTVTVNLQDSLGASLTGLNIPVTLQSASPIFNRTYTLNTTTGQVVFPSNMNATWPQIALPAGPYMVAAKRQYNQICNYYGYSCTTPTVEVSAQGDFTGSSTQAMNNLAFTSSGNLSGVVRKSTGEAVTSATISLGSSALSAIVLTSSPAADGSYRFPVLSPGGYSVQVSVLSVGGSNDTPITASQQVTVIAGQAVTADVTLPPLGMVSGQLLAWNGTPLSSTTVYLSGVGNSSISRTRTTDTGGNYTFSMVPPGTYKISASDPVTGAAATSADLTMVSGETLTRNLQFMKSGRVGATELFADGTAPPSSSNMLLEIRDAAGKVLASSNYFYSNPVSTPYFASNEAEFKVRLTYTYSQPSSYYTTYTSVSETTMSGFAGVSTTALPVSLTLPVNRGNVTVQLTNASGANYSGSAIPIELRDPVSGTVWGSCSSDQAAGNCTVNNLVVGSGGFAAKVVMNGIVIAETTASMTGSGQTQTVVLQLTTDPVAFPKTLFDANVFAYNIYGDGALYGGRNDVFYQSGGGTGGMKLTVTGQSTGAVAFSGASTGVAEEQGRELSVSQADLAGLTVNRKVYVPKDGYFARYLDIYSNPTAQPVTVDLDLATNFYYYNTSPAVRAAADGSSDAQPADRSLTGATWAVVDDSLNVDPFSDSSDLPAVALVWGGSSALLTPATVSFSKWTSYSTPASLKTGYRSVTVPSGGSLALLSFLAQQTTVASAKASAERLVQLPPEALSGLSSQELAMIANFTIPAGGTSTLEPLPPLTGAVTGVLKTYDGIQPAVLSGSGTVTLRSDSPYFSRTYSKTADNSGTFTFTGNANGIVVPLTGFTLQGNINISAYSVTSLPVSGTFAEGQASAAQDVLFTNTGRINAIVLRADGITPVNNATVRAAIVSDCQYCYYTPNFMYAGSGSYLLDFAQAGMHYLTAVIPPPPAVNSGGSSLTVTGTVTAAESATAPVELRLPPLGAISGSVRNRAGTPVSGNYLRLTSTTNANFIRYLSTYNGSNGAPAGTYAFADLPADTYLLEVNDSSYSGVVYRYTVTLAAGDTVTRDVQYEISGTLTGTVAFRSTFAEDPTYSPSYVSIEVRDPDSGKLLASTSNSNSSYTTPRFAGIGKPLTVKAIYQYYTGNGQRTFTASTQVPDFTSDGQQLTANLTLPVDRGNVLVKVVDKNNADFLKPVNIELNDPAGQVASGAYSVETGQNTFSNVSTELTTLTARVTYLGRNFDQQFTFVPNGTATVTVTIPLATLSGTVYAGDGATPLDGFAYSLTSADGSVSYPCGSQQHYNYYQINAGAGYVYRYYLNDITTCSSVGGTWSLTQLVYQNPADSWGNYVSVAREIPIQAGDQLTLHVRPYSGLGDFTHAFTYAGNPTEDATLPIFVAKGSVKRPDGSAVADASVTMVLTEAGTPSTDFTYSGWSDGSGAFTILGAKTGAFSLSTQTGMGAQGNYAGGGAIANLFSAVTGLDMTIEPTGTLTGTVTRGGVPLYDAGVTVTLPDRSMSQTFWTDTAGRFTALDVPFGSYTVTAETWDNSSDGNIYSNSVSGTLTTDVPAADLQLVFDLPPGTVFGTVRDNLGNTVNWNYELALTRVSTGDIFYPSTDNSGYYQSSNLPADGYLAEISTWGQNEGPRVTGSAYGILTDGGSLKLDLNLREEVTLGTTDLPSTSDGFKYGVGNGGVLAYGGDTASSNSSPFNSLYYFSEVDYSGSSFSADRGWVDQYGQFVLKPSTLAGGLISSRKLFVPPGGGYLRYLEILYNTTTTPLTVGPDVYGDLATPASGGWSYIVDPATAGSGYAIERASSDPIMPQLGMVLQGNGSVAASLQATWATADIPEWYWETVAPAGGRACILHFIFQSGPQDTNLEARAQALRDLDGAALSTLGFDPDPLYGLTTDERACIKNFNVPPAP